MYKFRCHFNSPLTIQQNLGPESQSPQKTGSCDKFSMQSSTCRGLIFINNFEGGLYAGLSQIPVFKGIVVAQKTHQPGHIDVVVIIEVTEPPEIKKECFLLNRESITSVVAIIIIQRRKFKEID